MSRNKDGNGKPWKARIYNKGVEIHLGLFDLFEQAVEARKLAEKNFSYHTNHGNTQ